MFIIKAKEIKKDKIEQSKHVKKIVEMFEKEYIAMEEKQDVKVITIHALEKMIQSMNDNHAKLQIASDK